MPCRVEFDGHNHWWFCCNCKDGPMNIFVTPSCTSCNDHCRCESGTFTVTPPKTPPHTDHAYHHPSNKGITSLDASKFQPADEPSPVSLVPDQGPDGHDQPSGATDGCISESVLDTQPDVQWNSLHEAIEQHTKTVVSLQSTLQQQLNLPAAPAIRSRPSGAQSKPRVQQGSSRRTSQNPSSRKQNQTNVRKVSKSWPGDQESDDDIHIQQPAAEDLPGPDPSLALQFACHFCKFDPHRHRNVKSCSRGYATASDLREHLTRTSTPKNNSTSGDHPSGKGGRRGNAKGSPHQIHECKRCLRVFPNENECNAHEQRGDCDFRGLCYPVEGIGRRLRDDFPKLKGGPKGESSLQDDIAWWNTVYRLLFGENVNVPSWIYNADEITTRSNDPELQDEYENRLIQTLQRGLPEAHMDMVVRNHFLSHNETKVQRLKRKLGDKEHFSAAHQVLSRPMNVVKSRRGVGTQASVPLRETGIDHCDHHESDEPLVEWIAQAIKANPTNPSGEQVTVPEDVPQHIDSLSDFDTNKNGSAAGPLPNEEHVDNNLQHWHDFEYLPDPLNQYSDPNPMVNTERGTSLPLMPSIPGTSASKDVSLPQKRPTPASVSTHNAHSPQTKPMDETPPHKRRKPAENEVPPPRGSLEDLANLPPSHNIGNFLVNDLLFDLSSTRTHPSDVIEPHEYADMHGVTSHGPPAAGFVEEMTDAEFEALLNTIEDTSTQG